MTESCVYTACPGWGDHEYCALRTFVEDGKILRTEKADYTGVEAHEASICQKGLMSWRQVYNPDRLLKPLKRAGERGEGKWEEISWDQALDEISTKIKEIQEKYGEESMVVWNLAASQPPSQGLLYLLGTRFTACLGATDPVHAQGLDNGAEFSLELDMGGGGYLLTDPAWMEESDTILVWGANPIENQQRVTNAMMEAKSRGAKIYDIGLVYDATAGKSDWFIPVRPGSDTALALAIAKVIVDEEKWDHEFILNKTVAPLLVDEETGLFARDAENNYYVWTKSEGAKSLPANTLELDADDTELFGEFEIDGKKVKPVFQLLKEHLVPYTPEHAADVCGVAPDDVVELAHQLEKSKAIFYMIAYGMRYRNQGEIHRAVTLLMALTGSDGYPGAGCGYSMVTSSWPIMYNSARIVAPKGFTENTNVVGIHAMRMNEFFEKAKTGCYHGFFKIQGNPVHNNPNRERWTSLFENMELVVDYDIWMTDTGELADYVLPDCMPFEREDIVAFPAYGHVVLQEPAIEPVGENRPPNWVFTEFAKKLGFSEFFDKTEDEWISMLLADTKGLVNADGTPITIEQLHEVKRVRPAVFPQVKYNATLLQKGFTTPSGRLEFYAEKYAPIGEALAHEKPSIEFPIPEGAKYPYQLFTGRQRFFMQSMFSDDPVLRELSGGEPSARMNPIDADREGLKDGDKIEVFNDRGHVILPVRRQEAVPPGTVHVWFGWRHKHFEEGMYSEMLVPCGGEEATDDVAKFWWDQLMEQKGGSLVGVENVLAGTWDTMWDVTCDVRKVDAEEGAAK